MPLVKGKELLKHAIEGKYAVPAFGFVNLEGAKAAIAAAEELNSPIILQTTQGGIDYAGHAQLAAIAISLAKGSKVPVALHLDHGRDLPYHTKSLELGYTSLMIDGSTLPFEDNIKITNDVIMMEKDPQISIEAELGLIGGKEDDNEDDDDGYTTVAEAKEFIEKTNGVDMLAIACGTAHGFYTKEPSVQHDLIREIFETVGVPLVLHGGTGVPHDQVTKAVEAGIRKANFDSELKQAHMKGVMEFMSENPNAYDLRKINAKGIEYATEVCKGKILAVKSNDKNWL